MEPYGANCIYRTDFAGYMLSEDAVERTIHLREALTNQTEIGFYGHRNLGMGIASSLAAVGAGVTRIDCSAVDLVETGAGNTPSGGDGAETYKSWS